MSRARIGGLVLCGALALRSTAAQAAPPSEARVELEAGLDAYEQGDFRTAATHFERSYTVEPSPQSLYAWAQAMRSLGDCEAAVELYRRFIDGGATGDSRKAAEQNEARCREQLARAQPVPEPLPAEPEVPPPVVAPAAAPAPRTPDVPTSPSRPRARTGAALLGVGAGAVVAGAIVLATGGARERRQSRTRDYDRFDALDPSIDRLYLAGGITLGVGAVLLATGAATFALARRRARPQTLTIAPSWTPAGAVGLTLRIAPFAGR